MRTAAVFFALLFICSPGRGQSVSEPVFVSAEWLSNHLADPNLVIVHVSFSRPDFRSGHIPGARFLWYDWLAGSTPDASTEMPSSGHADTLLEGLGITDSSRIVICYGGTSVTPAARIYLALSYFGLGSRTSILEGGLEAWKAGGRPISTDLPAPSRTRLSLRTSPGEIVDADQVRDALDRPEIAIIDARDRRFYDGMGGGTGRTGHIRGAKSIPFSSMVDSTSRLKDPAELRKILAEADLRPGVRLYVYCHVGQQACLVYAVGRLLGYTAAVYDGSFQDWSVRGEEYPVERTKKP